MTPDARDRATAAGIVGRFLPVDVLIDAITAAPTPALAIVRAAALTVAEGGE